MPRKQSALGEVQHDCLGPGGDFVRQVTAAWVGGVVLHPDHAELDDLVDVAGPQKDRVASVEQLGLPMLPQPVEAALGVVESEVPVTRRVDQVGWGLPGPEIISMGWAFLWEVCEVVVEN